MNSYELPYWHKLLIHFEKKGYIYNGLTLPFLIGSLEVLEPKSKLWSIDEITDSLNTHGCTILKCSNIGEYVIGSLDVETLKNKKLYHSPCSNIVFTDNSLNSVMNLDSLTKAFENLYESKISKREFSKNYGEWTYFTETDLIRIKEIK